MTGLDAVLPLTALGKPVPAWLATLPFHSFLMSEFSVSPSDSADELSDCKRIEQDNGPDSPGTHSSIVSHRCLVIIGIFSREHWCLNRLQSTAVDREEFYHGKQQKAFLKVSQSGERAFKGLY